MFLPSRLRSLEARRLLSRAPRQPCRRRRPLLEALEDRRLLSTFTVNSTGDSGTGSGLVGDLRYCINQANLAGGAETIAFDSGVFGTPQTINLTGGQLELSDTTGTETITGPAAGVTVSGGGTSRVFQVDTGVVASLAGLTISGGSVTGDYGGGIEVEKAGTLTLADSTVSGNSATDVGIFFNGIGGGIANAGWLTVTGSTFTNNSAHYVGGGIYNVGTLTVDGNSTFTNNSAYSGGGIENAGVMTLADSTFTNDSANVNGGGIDNTGTLTIEAGTKVTNSFAPAGGGINNSGADGRWLDSRRQLSQLGRRGHRQ